MTLERQYADLLRGSTDNSPLLTDGYKFSMAQAGFPLRREVFYLHFRRGGPLLMPFDFREVVKHLRPRLPDTRENGFLLANGYGMTPAMEKALQADIEMFGWDRGSWVNPNEPVLTIESSMFMASWLEALAIAFQFPMQIATAMYGGQHEFTASCEAEADIIRLVYESMMGILVHDETKWELVIKVDEEGFRKQIRERIERLSDALNGDIHRAFEVGTRAMSCYPQHRIILEECKAAGIDRTANVLGAYDLYMIPVGTTGHEHQERHGEDINGFRAIRDQRPEPPSYLFDTYDAVNKGIPAAVTVMREDPDRSCSVRFDSGDQEHQFCLYYKAEQRHDIHPLYLFMDGYDDVRTAAMEAWIVKVITDDSPVPSERRHYGLGSYFNPASMRSGPAMVYKLCQTNGRPAKKYSEKGKESLGGWPIVYFMPGCVEQLRLIGQKGDCYEADDFTPAPWIRPQGPSRIGPSTAEIADECYRRDFGKEPPPFDPFPVTVKGDEVTVLCHVCNQTHTVKAEDLFKKDVAWGQSGGVTTALFLSCPNGGDIEIARAHDENYHRSKVPHIRIWTAAKER